MSAKFSLSYFSSCHLHFLIIFLVWFHVCLSDKKSDDVLCIDGERQALIQFKHDLIDEADRLASWDGEKNDCCQWAGVVCDNITGHVHEIHLRGLDGHCDILAPINSYKYFEEGLKQRLKGNLSSSLLDLKQLQYLDLSCNDFEGNQIPRFIGSLQNLRYLNLSESNFGGMIPPQIGNLSELRVLSIGSLYGTYDPERGLTSTNIKWLSSLRWLHHLDMTHTNLGNANDWFQVINTLPSLGQLHMSRCGLRDSYSHVPSLNVTSLSMLDLSYNEFDNPLFPRWIFSLTNLVSLDLSFCNFNDPLPSSVYSFGNLTSLLSLHVIGIDFMNSPSVLKGLPSNLVSIDISSCGLSSSILDSFHNLTSLLSLDLSDNQLKKRIPNSLGNLCNIREIDLSYNDFSNISLSCLLQNLFECKSPSLESLTITGSALSGPIPYSIGRLSSLKKLYLDDNKLNGSIPESIGQLSSLEDLSISTNQLSGNLPISLGQLSKLEFFFFDYNLLTGIVTEAHFVKLMSLKFINGNHNNLTMKMQAANWIPPFQIQILILNSWTLGPQFPLWLQSQRDLIVLDISNTRISSIMPSESFWRSLPNLTYLYMSENHIKGTPILGFPTSLVVLNLSSNDFTGELSFVSNGSLVPGLLDLSNNFFVGSLHHFLCSNGMEEAKALYLGNNSFSGVNSKCWEKWRSLLVLKIENNRLSGEIPKTMSFIPKLILLNMRGNKISGSIPSWFGTKLTLLRILNLRSNNLDGNIPHELCHLSSILILNLADNYMSGNIPRCFYNFSVLSGKETTLNSHLFIDLGEARVAIASETLVTKGQEYTYESSLGLVRSLDLSNNYLSGHIPSELTALRGLRFLNLSQNQLTGRIPERIGDMKDLESFDLSLNKLSGELPMSLSRLTFLSSFNVSHNNLTGRVPTGTQLQGFNESIFFGNKLCGAPLSDCRVPVEEPTQTIKDQKEENGADWGLIISIVLGFFAGFWIIVAPLIVSTSWRITYYSIMNKLIKVHGL